MRVLDRAQICITCMGANKLKAGKLPHLPHDVRRGGISEVVSHKG